LGRIRIAPAPAGGTGKRTLNPKQVSARILFDDGTALLLVEHGTEKRARLWLAEDVETLPEIRALGPDPTRGELSQERFLEALRAESRQLKTFLTDQRALAGIGNGLSDEILYEARLSPLRLTGKVGDQEARQLYTAVRSVLERQTALLRESAGGALPQKEPREHYTVHDQAGAKCTRCGSIISRVSYADRETYYCPGCQTGGVPLKDRRLSKLLK
jgi:formamidopyrimidine-DNA glycosylase